MMALLRWLSRLIVLFIGAVFVLGQLFAGEFSLAGTLAAIGGVLAGLLAPFPSRQSWRNAVVVSGVVGLAGAALDVYEYYSVPHSSGNYYPWFLTGPFVLALLFIVWQAASAASNE